MAPKFIKKIGRGFRKLYCIKISDEDRRDPAYGVEDVDVIETPEESPKITSAKKEISLNENLDLAETPQISSPQKELFSPESPYRTKTPEIQSPKKAMKRTDYQLITLYKADDPAYEEYLDYDADISDDEDVINSSSSSEYFTAISDDEDDINSSSSPEYFTAEEDNSSNKSSSGSLMSDSELDVLESEMNRIFMDMQLLSRRIQQIPNNQNHTMKSDIGRFRKKFMQTDARIKKMFY